MTNAQPLAFKPSAGLTLIELVISLALSTTLLALIITAYVRVKVDAKSHEEQAEVTQNARWLSATLAHNIKSAAATAYLVPDSELNAATVCQQLAQSRLPAAVEGIDQIRRGALNGCFDMDDLAAADVLLLARDGDALFDGASNTRGSSADTGIDVYAVEYRTDARDYGCAAAQTVKSLVRYRHRHGKRLYKEELLPGVVGWSVRYGVAMAAAPGKEVHFFPASDVTDWKSVRAVRIQLSLASVCARSMRDTNGGDTFSWSQTIALRQSPREESNDAAN